MGLEAECTVRVGRQVSPGRALLEGDKLTFRGTFNLDIAFDAMQEVTVDGEALVVATADAQSRFELGSALAERWARLIKEPKTLFEKLEIRPDARVAAVDITDSLFLTALRERTAAVAEGRVPEKAPIIFFGAETKDALRKIQLLRARMTDDSVLWVVRPKAGKGLTEADLAEALEAAGLAETKLVPFSRTHVAHRCAVPLDQRGQARRRRPPIVSIPPSAPTAPVDATKDAGKDGDDAGGKKASKRPSKEPGDKKRR